jgi:hypothetical protein
MYKFHEIQIVDGICNAIVERESPKELPYDSAQHCEICGEPATKNYPLVEDVLDLGWWVEFHFHEACRRKQVAQKEVCCEVAEADGTVDDAGQLETLAKRMGVGVATARVILEEWSLIPTPRETCLHCEEPGTAERPLLRRFMPTDGICY